jgi:phospholipase/lecithinase/hemolysin
MMRAWGHDPGQDSAHPSSLADLRSSNPSAYRLVEQAAALYAKSDDYDRAVAMADAAIALGGPEQAHVVREAALDMAQPERAQAKAAMAQLERSRMVFERDLNGRTSGLFTAAARAAREIGDDPRAYEHSAVAPSMSSKTIAAAIARLDGTPYKEPEGVYATHVNAGEGGITGQGVVNARQPFESLNAR